MHNFSFIVSLTYPVLLPLMFYIQPLGFSVGIKEQSLRFCLHRQSCLVYILQSVGQLLATQQASASGQTTGFWKTVPTPELWMLDWLTKASSSTKTQGGPPPPK